MADETETPTHAIQLAVVPTEEWLAAVRITTVDAEGNKSVVDLHPHEAFHTGQWITVLASHMNDFNNTLIDKPVEARKEIMELRAQFEMPAAEDPFDQVASDTEV